MSVPESLGRLFELDAFEAGERADACFVDAVRDACAWHMERCEVFRTLCGQEGFSPDRIGSIGDLPRIPWLMVNVFKRYHLLSVPESAIVATFTSSGTTGQASHIAWDRGSMERQDAMRAAIMAGMGLVSDRPVNYLIFAHAPDIAGSKGAAHAQSRYAGFAPERDSFYAIHAGENGEPAFDAAECIDRMRAFSLTGLPVRIIGFPAFAWRVLREMDRTDTRLRFPGESLFILAGGWKGAQNEAVPKTMFAATAEARLGIPATRIRDVYGFVEHGVPYMTCEAGRFHVPVYSRAFVRKPGTMELLPKGERGLLHVVSPYNLAQPSLSVLSTDYAVLGDDCPCGRRTDTLEIAGRAGVSKHQGCAITAAELLKK
ncbi:MAG: acyl-protein synthetase [Geobacteraceae bacterium]|nr:acyl-protein synthetase [Geobacteraceae bacterium]